MVQPRTPLDDYAEALGGPGTRVRDPDTFTNFLMQGAAEYDNERARRAAVAQQLQREAPVILPLEQRANQDYVQAFRANPGMTPLEAASFLAQVVAAPVSLPFTAAGSEVGRATGLPRGAQAGEVIAGLPFAAVGSTVRGAGATVAPRVVPSALGAGRQAAVRAGEAIPGGIETAGERAAAVTRGAFAPIRVAGRGVTATGRAVAGAGEALERRGVPVPVSGAAARTSPDDVPKAAIRAVQVQDEAAQLAADIAKLPPDEQTVIREQIAKGSQPMTTAERIQAISEEGQFGGTGGKGIPSAATRAQAAQPPQAVTQAPARPPATPSLTEASLEAQVAARRADRTLEAEVAAARGRRPPPGQPPTGAIPPVGGVPPTGPVQRLIEFLNQTPPLRARTEAERAKELGRRFSEAERRIASPADNPRQALLRGRGALSGPLPTRGLPQVGEQVDDVVRPIAGVPFSQQDFDEFYNIIRTANVQGIKKVRAEEALTKAFLGGLPQPNELDVLEEIFGKNLVTAISRHMKRGTWNTVIEAMNFPRAAFQTVLDFGAFLRQGAVLVPSRPIRATRSAGRALRSFVDEKYALQLDSKIRADKEFARFTESPLGRRRIYIAPLEGAASPTMREEAFISDWAYRVPGLRDIVKASSRIHNTFLNQMRYGVMKDIVKSWEKTGSLATDQELDILARHLNFATGRGSLGPLEKNVRELSAALYAPRFLVSRAQLPLPTLQAAIARNPRLLRETSRDLVIFIGTGMTIATLLNKTGAAKVETDARSPTFGRARVGNVTYDYWGGYQPLARYGWQLMSGESKNITTGKVSKLSPGGLSGKSGETAAWRFLRTKLAPGPGMAVDIYAGKDLAGRKLEPTLDTAGREAANNLLPLFAQDILDVTQEEGFGQAAATGVPSFFGVGVTTFSERGK